LFPKAMLQSGTGAYRVQSADLGRDYEEELSIHPDGVQDFGPRKRMSPCDLMMEFGGAPTIQVAALTLCEWLGRAPADFGWTEPRAKQQAGETKAKPASQQDDTDGLVTEGSVSDAFTAAHKATLRFDHTAGRWFVWDGIRWKREETRLAYRWAHAKARELAADTGNDKAMISAGKAAFAGGVERLAQSDRAFALTHEAWDRDPWALGTPGGVVDLRTGALRPA